MRMISAQEDEQQWSNSGDGGRMAGGEQSEETIGGKPLTLQSRQEA